MAHSFGTPFKAEHVTSSATGPALVAPATPTGRRLIIVEASGISGTNNAGLASIGADTNTLVRRCSAQRQNSIHSSIWDSVLSDALEASNPVSPVYSFSWSRKVAIGVAIDGLDGTVNAQSSGSVAPGDTSAASNGSSSSPAGGSITTTVADCLLIAAVGTVGDSNTLTPSGGWAELDHMYSTAASTYRNIHLCYRVVSATGTYSFSGTTAASSGWSVCCAAYPIAGGGGGGGVPGDVLISSVKKTAVDDWVLIGGVKKNVVNRWQLVSGVKKSIP